MGSNIDKTIYSKFEDYLKEGANDIVEHHRSKLKDYLLGEITIENSESAFKSYKDKRNVNISPETFFMLSLVEELPLDVDFNLTPKLELDGIVFKKTKQGLVKKVKIPYKKNIQDFLNLQISPDTKAEIKKSELCLQRILIKANTFNSTYINETKSYLKQTRKFLITDFNKNCLIPNRIKETIFDTLNCKDFGFKRTRTFKSNTIGINQIKFSKKISKAMEGVLNPSEEDRLKILFRLVIGSVFKDLPKPMINQIFRLSTNFDNDVYDISLIHSLIKKYYKINPNIIDLLINSTSNEGVFRNKKLLKKNVYNELINRTAPPFSWDGLEAANSIKFFCVILFIDSIRKTYYKANKDAVIIENIRQDIEVLKKEKNEYETALNLFNKGLFKNLCTIREELYKENANLRKNKKKIAKSKSQAIEDTYKLLLDRVYQLEHIKSNKGRLLEIKNIKKTFESTIKRREKAIIMRVDKVNWIEALIKKNKAVNPIEMTSINSYLQRLSDISNLNNIIEVKIENSPFYLKEELNQYLESVNIFNKIDFDLDGFHKNITAIWGRRIYPPKKYNTEHINPILNITKYLYDRRYKNDITTPMYEISTNDIIPKTGFISIKSILSFMFRNQVEEGYFDNVQNILFHENLLVVYKDGVIESLMPTPEYKLFISKNEKESEVVKTDEGDYALNYLSKLTEEIITNKTKENFNALSGSIFIENVSKIKGIKFYTEHENKKYKKESEFHKIDLGSINKEEQEIFIEFLDYYHHIFPKKVSEIYLSVIPENKKREIPTNKKDLMFYIESKREDVSHSDQYKITSEDLILLGLNKSFYSTVLLERALCVIYNKEVMNTELTDKFIDAIGITNLGVAQKYFALRGKDYSGARLLRKIFVKNGILIFNGKSEQVPKQIIAFFSNIFNISKQITQSN